MSGKGQHSVTIQRHSIVRAPGYSVKVLPTENHLQRRDWD